MASFVEQATLKVNDQSSAQIRKINAELAKLAQTARALKSIHVNITINEKGVQSALRNLKALQAAARQAGSARVNINVNASGLARAQQQINQLRQSAARPITVNTRGGGGGGGGGVGGGRGRAGPAATNTGIRHQFGNFPLARGAASVVIGGTAYAVAANVTKGMIKGVTDTEDARMRLRQAGFDKGQPEGKTPAVDYFMEAARQNQKEFNRVPAALIADAAVEQLSTIRADKTIPDKFKAYEEVFKRVAENAQTMAITYKDPEKGAENARQLERVTQIMGHDIDDTTIRKLQQAAMKSVVASGGEISMEEAVRTLQQLGSTVAKSLSPTALGDILSMRDEGGKASTAEWRMTVQDLMRDSLGKKDKAAMAKIGLRTPSGDMDPTVVKEAGEDLVGMVEKRIIPFLKKSGMYEGKSSAEIGAFLDKHGFSTSGARGVADIVTSKRSGEIDRNRAAREFVDLNPHLGDRTFRGGTERLNASMQTAMGRALGKSGGAFADAVAPFSIAMDKAGKAAEGGHYGDAAFEMTKGVSQMMGGPAGAIITAMTAMKAASVLIDPNASLADKTAASMLTASSALLTAAGMMQNYYGGGDPNKELERLNKLKQEGPGQIEQYKKRLAEEMAKPPGQKDHSLIDKLQRQLADAQTQARTLSGEIAVAEAKVAALKKEEAIEKGGEAAKLEQMRRDSGLDPGTGLPVTPAPGTAGANAAIIQQLQQLGEAKLAGVKSIVDLMNTLNQSSSLKSREELAKGLGYTGPLGGSAAMNTFLIDYFRKLAAQPPPAAVTPPPPADVTPPPPVEVKPPDKPIPVEQPLIVVPEPSAGPQPLPDGSMPGHGGAITPIPPLPRRSAVDVLDFDPVGVQLASMFTKGATTIGDSGESIGVGAAGILYSEASGIGETIGSAAASIISGATVNVNVPNMANMGGGKPSTGGLRTTAPPTIA